MCAECGYLWAAVFEAEVTNEGALECPKCGACNSITITELEEWR